MLQNIELRDVVMHYLQQYTDVMKYWHAGAQRFLTTALD